MRVSTRFSVAVHIMALLALQGDIAVTSEMMAMSVGNNPVVVRQVMSSLKKAGLIETKNGLPGGRLAKQQEEITLRDIYQAVRTSTDASFFDIHQNPNPECPVGGNIKGALKVPLGNVQTAMESELANYSLKDITAYIVKMYPDNSLQNDNNSAKNNNMGREELYGTYGSHLQPSFGKGISG